MAQPQEHLLDEARTVYLGNLKRRENGQPPLKWNKQLTGAARWYGWDSVENRAPGFCGHDDTQGHLPGWRALNFGYKGLAGAENAFCGSALAMTPQGSITAWMNSAGHKDNLLDPNSQEIGIGFYLSGDRGYVTQDFGRDDNFTPLIINDEAITTTSAQVNLYLHNRVNDRVDGPGRTVAMMVSNDIGFTGVNWEPYAAEKAWTLAAGKGWRTVYVKTKDALNRKSVVSDMIYVGSDVPITELNDGQMSSNQPGVDLVNLGSPGWNQVQFAPGWVMDDGYNLQVNYGDVSTQADTNAWGGTAACMKGGPAESAARIWTSTFFEDVPMQAYFRVRVNNNTSPAEVLRLQVTGGDNISPMLRFNGMDFTQPNVYQDFRVPFTFHKNGTAVFLMFEFWRSGGAEVCIDAVSIFPQPNVIPSDKHMFVIPPDGNYRGQIFWGRYANDAGQFAPSAEFDPFAPAASPITFTVKSQVFLATLTR